jgi:ribosomal-protein-alanine N-acetyltransferase
VEPLTPIWTPRVRLSLLSRFDARSLADHVRRFPAMALVASGGRQYVVAGPWRKRADIAELIEASTGELRSALVGGLSRQLAAHGFKLMVLDYGLESRDPTFYRTAGFALVERIFEYERPLLPVTRLATPPGTLRPYRSEDRDAVLEVERESFPWLWWNSQAEWDGYVSTRGVEIRVACRGDQVVGYAGFVVYNREGHLDRLAVHNREQGRGFGAFLLTEALTRLQERGAHRVALTTQETNLRSQRLYEQNGFRRGRWTYDIHGSWLGQPEETAT